MTRIASVISSILPATVASAEAYGDPPGVQLFAAEEAAISRAVDKRRREFATVRHCARLGLADLGLSPTALVPGRHGAPRWPAGVVGSMTHCAGYRGAAVARARDVRTIGIDAEPHAALPAAVLPRVALAAELVQIAELHVAIEAIHFDRLLFCCKEAAYKAWFPLTGRVLGFDDALITIDPATFAFTARLLGCRSQTSRTGQLDAFSGRWMVHEGLILATITVPVAGV